MKLPSWNKKGIIFSRESGDFFKSHAMRPIPYIRKDGSLRIFMSSRCANDMMHPTYIDVDSDDLSKVLKVNETPLLELGNPGLFDDSGITLGSIFRTDNRVLVYYTGWKRRRYGVSFELSIGVAELLDDGDRLVKLFTGPILGQDRHHPYLVGGPYVSRLSNGVLSMWYCSGTSWKQTENGPEPIYTVFRATSNDGLYWTPTDNEAAIPYAFDGEVVSAPWVIETSSCLLMYYCFRGSADRVAKKYSIGLATSLDGRTWDRCDSRVGISKSDSGWDSEMTCYPALINYGGKTNMFYTGNAVGRGGIGYAIADEFLQTL